MSFTFNALLVWGQSTPLLFENTLQINVSDTIEKRVLQSDWIDLSTNEELSFITLELTREADELKYQLIRHQIEEETLMIDTLGIELPSPNVLYANIDNSRGIDIISYYQDKIYIFLNQENDPTKKPTFSQDTIAIDGANLVSLHIEDLDQNGSKDFIMINKGSTAKNTLVGRLLNNRFVLDTLSVNTDLATSTHFNDVSSTKILSFGEDSLFVHSFNDKNKLVQDTSQYFAGKVLNFAQGDINENNTFDYLLSIEDDSGTQSTYLYYDFSNLVPLDSLKYDKLFIADFNSDGLSDLYGENANGRYVFRQNEDESFEKQLIDSLGTSKIVAIGDSDRDGDLDLGVTDEQKSEFNLLINETGKNEAPLPPAFLLFFPGVESFALYWPESVDDHSKTLTYDLDIRPVRGPNYISGLYEADSSFRQITRHGNQNTERFAEYFNLPEGNYEIRLQAVDNSYFANAGSICTANGAGFCEEVIGLSKDLCAGEVFNFSNNGRVSHWFSSFFGYLGQTDNLAYLASIDDTLYTVAIDAESCEDYQFWELSVDKLVDYELLPDQYGCEGETISLLIDQPDIQYDSIQWQIDSLIFKGNTVEYVLNQSTEVLLEIHQGTCTVLDTFNLNISKPKITVSPRFTEILTGNSVQISATPGYTYNWTPSSGLNDSFINNPLATPLRSTTYLATALDSIGCITQDSVQITVRQVGFLPELFTPNSDGMNDLLKVHQLTSAENFFFQITDKRGNVVFQTESLEELRNGWNGNSGKSQAPTGSYLWQVRGNDDEGLPLLINGEQKGVINLVR